MKDTNISYLLKYCADMPELYNKVANKLWAEFNIQSAEVTLLCTYMINEWRTKDEYRELNKRSDKKVGRDQERAQDNTAGHGRDNRSIKATHSQL